MLNDIRHAMRGFLRTPAFTTVALLTLALGIGATTAIFSVVNAVLLRPLPYPAAEQLVVARVSLPDFKDVRAAVQAFDGTAAWASNLYNLRTGNDTQQVLGGVVSNELLPLLGVQPIIGRTFGADDERRETVVLAYALWQSRFGGDPGVIGRTIDLSGTSYDVIGVAPAWFRFPSAEFQLWTPLGTIDAKAPQQAGNRALRIFNMLGRRRAGVSLQQAQAEVTAVSTRLAAAYPATNSEIRIELEPLYERLVGGARPALTVLLATVGLLLLIACANVANLMLARTTVREREMAIRVALGAGRGRLLRLLVIESMTIALAGGALGMLVAMWGVDLLPAVLEAHVPRSDGIRIDASVLAFSLCATLLTGLLFGLAPALHGTTGVAGTLKDSSRAVAGHAGGRRVRRTIAVVQMALAIVVLVGAGLLVRSFMSLTARDAGFVPSNLVTFNVQLVALPDGPARAQAVSALMERISNLPGVEHAGGSTGFPPITAQRGTRFAVDGLTLTPDQDTAYFMAATPGVFEALRTPVLRGRAIGARDTAGAPLVAVVSRVLAGRLFPNGDAVGKRLKLINPEQADEWRTIVGVVGDVQYQGLDGEAGPAIYTPFAQTPFLWLYVMVRSPNPGPVMGELRTAVPAAVPSLSAADVKLMTDVVSRSVAEPRFQMMLVSAFALLALLLAAIGIYGVIAYAVVQRTREIGVRIALGARRADVMRLVLGEGLGMAAAGVALGLAGAAALTRLMASLLFSVTPHDPLTFAAGASLLLIMALLASFIPARRALRVDPITALRTD
jgi:putative ABC transport system permease protein